MSLALALALGAQLASAQQFTPPTFDGIDTDKGGSLSKEEVAAWVATIPAGPNGPANADEVFGRWDANKDGSVSKEEFDSRPRPPAGGGPPPGN
jgi:Ca2+-binding EF-hand superfamily protein